MITLKDFIEIDILLENSFIINEEIIWSDLNRSKINYSNIHGNDVRIKATNNNGFHSIEFTVNDKLSKNNVDSNTGKHILHHISKTVKHYTDNYVKSGDIISFTASDKDGGLQSKKDSVYRLFAKKLANNINGNYREAKGNHFIKKN